MKKLIFFLFLLPAFGDVPTQKELDQQFKEIKEDLTDLRNRLDKLNPEPRMASKDELDKEQDRRIQKIEDLLEKQQWTVVALIGNLLISLIKDLKRGNGKNNSNGT